MKRLCYHCQNDIGPIARVGRRETCTQCGYDLHCCRNCAFYDTTAYNACREPQAERQLDKDIGNFCDYFSFRQSHSAATSATSSSPNDPKQQLDALFKKT